MKNITNTVRPDPPRLNQVVFCGCLCLLISGRVFTYRGTRSESITKDNHSRRELKQGTPKPTLWKYRDAKSQSRHGKENRSLIEPLGIVAATRKAETWGGKSNYCESRPLDIVSQTTNHSFIGLLGRLYPSQKHLKEFE